MNEIVMPVPSTNPVIQLQSKPCIVAIDMGYGHLRPAHALADILGAPVLHADRPPLAREVDERTWGMVRKYYEWMSRTSQHSQWGWPVRTLLNAATDITSLYPERDLSPPDFGSKLLESAIRKGLGKALVEHLSTDHAPLLTTFYMPAIAADRQGYDRVFCVVTDSDVHRVWAPVDPANTRITYLVPTHQTRRRMRSYGVPESRIVVTGYPLPHELLGGTQLSALKANLAARLVRLDPSGAFRNDLRHAIPLFLGNLPADSEVEGPPLLTFAVGGAGAQVALVREFLPNIRRLLADRQIRVALVAGRRPEVRDLLVECVVQAGLERYLEMPDYLEILFAPSFETYLQKFNALLARTDALWTKPSEMTFFAALGIPIIFSWPVGTHESHNRHWALENGAGLKQREPRYAGEWLKDWLKDGTLAAAAWAGFTRLPKFGLYEILEAIASTETR